MSCPEHHETPYASYAGLIALFGASTAFALRRAAAGEALSLADIALIGVAAHKVTSIIAKDRATSVLRLPVTEQRAPEGESLEEEPAGEGLRRALGELVTCPYCLGPWIAAALLTAYTSAPRWVRPLLGLFSAVAISDLLHDASAKLKR